MVEKIILNLLGWVGKFISSLGSGVGMKNVSLTWGDHDHTLQYKNNLSIMEYRFSLFNAIREILPVFNIKL